jgi:hypothetical protein
MNDSDQPVGEKTKKLTLKSTLAWVIGGILVFAGIGSLTTSIFSGLLMLLAAAFLLPPVYSLIQEKTKIKLSGAVRAIIVVVLFAIAANIGTADDQIKTDISNATTEDASATKQVEEVQTVAENVEASSTPTVPKSDTATAPSTALTKIETKTEPTSSTQTNSPTSQNDRAGVLAVLKANASKKWGDDYQMVKFEYDNQVEAYDWVTAQTKHSDLMAKAKAKWKDDYQMVKFEYTNQVTAYEWVMAQTAHPDIMAKAKQKWGLDYQMVKFEYENQLKAYNDL